MSRKLLPLSILSICLVVAIQVKSAGAQHPGQFPKAYSRTAPAASGQREDDEGTARMKQTAAKCVIKAVARTPVGVKVVKGMETGAKKVCNALYAGLIAVGAAVVKLFASMIGNRNSGPVKSSEA